jgi:UDP-N-acetylglucosamine 2-epimerase (non-hydrolysing)
MPLDHPKDRKIMKVLSVFGTRPEAVKMAPVVQELARTAGIEARVCVTAQHRDILDQVLRLFSIIPDFDLDVMEENQTLAEVSAHIFQGLDPVLISFQPDWVLVQGDTTTVAITALLSYYHKIRVGHVEAGLRTHNKWQPFPEEVNRRVAGVIADLHFAPTEWARNNLLKEGIPTEQVVVTGNPVIDALQVVANHEIPEEITHLMETLGIRSSGGKSSGKKLILVTAHRRENFGPPLEQICTALIGLAERGDVEIVYPVHPNPKVQETTNRLLKGIPHITLLPALDYLSMVHMMKNAYLVLTDSGGIQEEAPFFGIPVLVLRKVTERPEGVQAGVLKMVGTESKAIIDEANQLLDQPTAYARMAKAVHPFGDGQAAGKIVRALMDFTQV